MKRQPNKKQERTPAGLRVQLTPTEFNQLKFNQPGPSGQLGGYQRFENWLIENTNHSLWLPPEQEERLLRYIQSYGQGGPNARIRAAFIPALRRLGILVNPNQQTRKEENKQ